jgi:hypothetical protein
MAKSLVMGLLISLPREKQERSAFAKFSERKVDIILGVSLPNILRKV